MDKYSKIIDDNKLGVFRLDLTEPITLLYCNKRANMEKYITTLTDYRYNGFDAHVTLITFNNYTSIATLVKAADNGDVFIFHPDLMAHVKSNIPVKLLQSQNIHIVLCYLVEFRDDVPAPLLLQDVEKDMQFLTIMNYNEHIKDMPKDLGSRPYYYAYSFNLDGSEMTLPDRQLPCMLIDKKTMEFKNLLYDVLLHNHRMDCYESILVRAANTLDPLFFLDDMSYLVKTVPYTYFEVDE